MKHTPTLFISMLVTLAAASTAASAIAFAGDDLSLDAFLKQVKEKNDGVKGTIQGSTGAALRKSDADLLYSPYLTLDGQLLTDKKPNLFLAQITGTVNNTYALGFSKLFSSGTTAKLSYNLGYQQYLGSPSQVAANGVHIATPQIEFRQPLWRNFFGVETRALHTVNESDALAKEFEQSYLTKTSLADAEISYWRLALARQVVTVQKEALSRAQKILDYNTRRANLQLADKADVLQSEALLELRRLELQQATDEERTSRLVFNQARGVDNDGVSESLLALDKDDVAERIEAPVRAGVRDDVKAAQQRERQSVANSQIGIEKSKPTAELYGTYAFNGQQPALGDAFTQSFTNAIPTRVVGLKVAIPLDFSDVSRAHEGFRKEQLGAELVTSKKAFDQDRDWADLTQKFTEAKKRLTLAKAIETAQEKKLNYERERAQRGRSTTFQVLTFEQDFSSAQLSRIRTQADVLNIVSRMKVFTSGGSL